MTTQRIVPLKTVAYNAWQGFLSSFANVGFILIVAFLANMDYLMVSLITYSCIWFTACAIGTTIPMLTIEANQKQNKDILKKAMVLTNIELMIVFPVMCVITYTLVNINNLNPDIIPICVIQYILYATTYLMQYCLFSQSTDKEQVAKTSKKITLITTVIYFLTAFLIVGQKISPAFIGIIFSMLYLTLLISKVVKNFRHLLIKTEKETLKKIMLLQLKTLCENAAYLCLSYNVIALNADIAILLSLVAFNFMDVAWDIEIELPTTEVAGFSG